MELDATTVYLVMQADAFKDSICAASLMLGIMCPIILGWLSFLCHTFEHAKAGLFAGLLAVLCICFGLFLALASGLTPSTKTAASMIVLPAIVNNETVMDEASDVYRLAKDALSDLVDGGGEDE